MEIFLDIEVIPGQHDWIRDYIAEKTKPPGNIKKPESIEKWYAESHAETVEEALGKTSFDGAMNHIVCFGCAIGDEEPVSFSAKTVEEEKAALIEFYTWLQSVSDQYGRVFVGHNITGFDLKIIRQRSIVLGVKPPLGIPFDAKPWDKNPFDTCGQWDMKNFASLDKISRAFGVGRKGEIDGSMVYEMWKNGLHKEIAEYCKSDVLLVRRVYNKMKLVC